MGEGDMSGRRGAHLLIGLLAGSWLSAAGCNRNEEFLTEDRLDRGLVIILPGIEGESGLNQNIRRGLIAGGVHCAMPIHSWGRPIPLAGVLINQMDFLGNRLSGIGVKDMIVNYQDSHPGKPVYVVGHSGGGGVAVFAAEALPKDRKIDGLILLSASISSAYNLKKAASRCSKGIVNFYNPDDAGLLGIGTTVLGTVDGTHGPSAGLIGFDRAGEKGHENVYQVKLSGMDGDGDPHASTTHVHFVSLNVAPWVFAEQWPVSSSVARLPEPGPPPAVEEGTGKAAKPEGGQEDEPREKPKEGPEAKADEGPEKAEKGGEENADPQDKPDGETKQQPKGETEEKAEPRPKAEQREGEGKPQAEAEKEPRDRRSKKRKPS
jgi:pimeloyl-ACP methyl ester carboxylesterase